MTRRNTTRIGIAGILLVGFVLGYIVACSSNQPAKSVRANEEPNDEDNAAAVGATIVEWSRTKPYPKHDVYYPGTEELKPDEIRVIACGTGMPQPRLKQAAACFLVELGNGDKFIFDMGEGSYERLTALGIPLDQLDKVFLGHLHLDHAGDFPAFWLTRGVNAGRTPIRLWGPNGVKPEWGTKSWADHIHKAWGWEVATRGSAIDPRGLQIDVTEFDWKEINNVVYEENDVVIRTIPAIHGDQSVSFILEWNGLKFAFSSDTMPNKWWIEHTKGVDLSIHECVLPPELWVEKYSFDPGGAVYAGTQGHTTPAAFGKVMSMTEPRHAVAYHFQNDFDTGPVVEKAIRTTYDGPLDLAQDFMVWNVTKSGTRTRMAAPNHERYPEPAQRSAEAQKGAEGYTWDALNFEGVERETAGVINKVLREFNEKYGTDVKPTLTGVPFKDDKSNE